ncbi:MAG TPA: winged helix-turn-helix domain-containing protein [Candidatus Angelobacter sp.]|nr:winged helix-turn-helix domain-containing protein [Candidatus Angelobacter sp.]
MKEKHAISSLGHLLADPGRSAILLALLEGRELAAGELARTAQLSAQSASGHLAKLNRGGLITMQRDGRQRYYTLAGPRVANALEALGAISTVRPAGEYLHARIDRGMLTARSCYDHLAGRIGVALTDAMLKQRVIVAAGERDYRVTSRGADWLEKLGVAMEPLRHSKRNLARRCLDWTERRPHVSGALGAALMQHFLDEAWLARQKDSRALRITHKGMRSFAELGLPSMAANGATG